MSKYIIEFSKLGLMKYTSHLDMIRLFKRTFKKANIKLVHSQGFNPHPKMAFVLPLSLGYESNCELLEFEVERTELTILEIKERMNDLLPEGISINSIRLDEKNENLSGRVSEAEYIIGFPVKLKCACSTCHKTEGDTGEECGQSFNGKSCGASESPEDNGDLGEVVKLMSKYWGNFADDFMRQEKILVQKRAKAKHRKKGSQFKEVDIKPLIVTLHTDLVNNNVFISTRIKAGSKENLNPELLMMAIINFANLETTKDEGKILRTEIVFES